ncbi:hypothetical protein GCM10011571_10650 [Marinithermofilum abyssi]|uniref:Uncharacterized protein n=1 Tax=Marinithermofilum abyssi TaxID=1571185 RepID=A0A8J2YAD1_9BACL|nr:hypothetical protein [Marinithermofilum abyssi]GGE11207.1 hypothetical protein GCM10011571_10650 [Marinithermofilum abyssi]
MNPGLFSLLANVSLLILLQTGWMEKMGKDLDTPSVRLRQALFLLLSLTWVDLPLRSGVNVNAGLLLCLLFCLHILKKTERQHWAHIFSMILLMGSTVLLLQEMYRSEPILLTYTSQQVLPLLLAWLVLLSTPRFGQQTLVLIGGVSFAEGMHLLIHQHEIPHIIGDSSFFDMMWMAWSVVMAKEYGWAALQAKWRNLQWMTK